MGLAIVKYGSGENHAFSMSPIELVGATSSSAMGVAQTMIDHPDLDLNASIALYKVQSSQAQNLGGTRADQAPQSANISIKDAVAQVVGGRS